jgi:putative lipoprotein
MRRSTLAAAFVALTVSAPVTVCAQDALATVVVVDDPWFGADKALHFGASATLGAGGYLGGALVLDEPWQRATAGATLSLGLGTAKELYDLAGHGHPSWRDMTWNVVGTVLSVGLCWAIDLTF